ncbi:MAG: ATP-binding protein [Ignavibacteria bacterium]|nr:ATP-binding protein [Ignavibacteria bacterium]
MYIYKFKEFITESISEPIPELNKKSKNMIFLLGAPGVGKSEFINYFLIPKMSNYKIFDPDKYSDYLIKISKEPVIRTQKEKYQKFQDIKKTIKRLQTEYDIPIELTDEEIMDIINKNIWVKDIDRLIDIHLNNFMTTNKYSDIIFDTTGNSFNKIKKYFEMAKENNYNIIFIKIVADVKTAVFSNLKRGRRVQIDYQLDTIERSFELEKKYMDLKPNAFYVYNRDTNILSKYENNKLIIKKQKLIKK